MDKELITLQQVIKKFNIDDSVIYDLLVQKKLTLINDNFGMDPYVRWRFDPSQVEECLQSYTPPKDDKSIVKKEKSLKDTPLEAYIKKLKEPPPAS